MPHAQRIPSLPRRIRQGLHPGLILALASAPACVSLHSALATPPDLLLIPAELAHAAGLSPLQAEGAGSFRDPARVQATAVTLALRVDAPEDRHDSWLAQRIFSPHHAPSAPARAAIVTFGGPRRDQTALLRVLHADTIGRKRAARAVAGAAADDSVAALIVALTAGTPRDVEAMLGMLTVLANSVGEAGIGSMIVHVPGHDTAGYPTRAVARTASALLISPHPPAIPAEPAPFFTERTVRQLIGMRAAEVGAGRLILLLPLHGYLWQRRSPPQPITYRGAAALVGEWRVPLTRDAESQMLHARAPDGAALWVPDAAMVAHIVHEARAMGVGRFAFIFGAGEDPEVFAAVSGVNQTTSSSR